MDEESVPLNGQLGQDPRCEANKSERYPWKAMVFLMVAAATQSYASSGLQAVLELYFTTFLFKYTLLSFSTDGINKLATTCFNIWVGIMDTAALSAGFLADLLLGNWKTQILSNVFNCIGLSLLMFSTWQLFYNNNNDNNNTAIPTTHPNHLTNLTSANDETLDLTLASVGLLLAAVGYGQLQAIQSVFVGDQFTDTQHEAKAHSFSWYYLFLNVGSLLSESGAPILRQTFNFLVCYSTVAGAVLLSTFFYFLGLPSYRKISSGKKQKDGTTVTVVADSESESLLGAENANGCAHVEQKPTTPPMSRWNKLKSTLEQLRGIIKVFTPLIVYWMLFYQQNSTWVLQGGRMNCYFRQLHVPPDLMPSFNDVLVIIFIPLFDYWIYPHIERVMNFKVKPLHKIGAGMICVALAFVLAGLLELYIKAPDVDCRGNVNIAWQVPQYILISFAEVLVAVTGLEFAYTQAPEHLRNVVTAMWCISQALGAALMAGLAEIAIPRQWAFFVYAMLMSLLIVVSACLNWNYKYRQ